MFLYYPYVSHNCALALQHQDSKHYFFGDIYICFLIYEQKITLNMFPVHAAMLAPGTNNVPITRIYALPQ